MNLLITGAWRQALTYIEELQKQHNVTFMQWENETLPCEYDWVEGVIGNGIFLFHPIEKFKNLKYVQLIRAGYDRVPMNYIQEHNIEIYNAKGVYSIPMAEFAIAGILQFYKHSEFFELNQKKHEWKRNRELQELNRKEVCIVGCGDVGRECAKRFQAFGCHVNGVNRRVREDFTYENFYKLESLKQVVKNADIVVLTIALTEETKHLIDREVLESMKSTAILVNLSRGEIVDTEALIESLPNIGGAVLDVFEEEPLSEESVLWEMENVILTPHNSFVGDGNEERLNRLIFDNLGRR